MEYRFDFIGSVNDENILALRNYIVSLNGKISKLTINISSLGGSVSSGITVYNFLKQFPFPIVTHNLGEVSSAALLLYMAGGERTSEEISKFMIHPLAIGVSGDLPYYKVQELLNGIDADVKNYLAVINRETENLKNLYDIEHYLKNDNLVLNKQKAYDCGIVTKL